MSPRQESALKSILIGVAITLAASILIAAYNSKEGVAQHAADMAAIDGKLQRLLDLSCKARVDERACK